MLKRNITSVSLVTLLLCLGTLNANAQKRWFRTSALEFGLIGGLFLVILYLWFLFRIVIISNKSESVFGSLLAVSMGLPIVFQAFINMSVAVELMPVTGQTLPLISSGGTSIWMTCLSIGIILSVSRKYESKNEEIDNTNPLEILKETI